MHEEQQQPGASHMTWQQMELVAKWRGRSLPRHPPHTPPPRDKPTAPPAPPHDGPPLQGHPFPPPAPAPIQHLTAATWHPHPAAAPHSARRSYGHPRPQHPPRGPAPPFAPPQALAAFTSLVSLSLTVQCLSAFDWDAAARAQGRRGTHAPATDHSGPSSAQARATQLQAPGPPGVSEELWRVVDLDLAPLSALRALRDLELHPQAPPPRRAALCAGSRALALGCTRLERLELHGCALMQAPPQALARAHGGGAPGPSSSGREAEAGAAQWPSLRSVVLHEAATPSEVYSLGLHAGGAPQLERLQLQQGLDVPAWPVHPQALHLMLARHIEGVAQCLAGCAAPAVHELTLGLLAPGAQSLLARQPGFVAAHLAEQLSPAPPGAGGTAEGMACVLRGLAPLGRTLRVLRVSSPLLLGCVAAAGGGGGAGPGAALALLQALPSLRALHVGSVTPGAAAALAAAARAGAMRTLRQVDLMVNRWVVAEAEGDEVDEDAEEEGEQELVREVVGLCVAMHEAAEGLVVGGGGSAEGATLAVVACGRRGVRVARACREAWEGAAHATCCAERRCGKKECGVLRLIEDELLMHDAMDD